MDISVDNSQELNTIVIRDQNGTIQEFDMRDELRISRDNLQEDFINQPVKYAYWVAVLEKMRLYLESHELKLEQVYARLYEPCRQGLIQAGTAKPTKEQITSSIVLQENYIEAKEQVMMYSFYVKRLQGVVKAWEQRREMLIQYGADNRKSFDQTKKMHYSQEIGGNRAEEPPSFMNQ